MSSESKGSGFFSGFIIGIILGAIITLFLSQKGKGSFRGTLAEMLRQGQESIREAIEEGKSMAAKKEAEYLAGIGKGSNRGQ